MQHFLRKFNCPARAVVVTAALAITALAGGASSAIAAVPAGHAVRVAVTTSAGREFDGFGEGRSAVLALRAARNDASRQATAAGFSVCSTLTEDSGFDPGFGTFVAESDIFCTG
ncbi:MAG TPA: hypothetical protein VFI65_12565 [Streptosporangiaceae bacterium]|nr:hypothetical protein [Streptosporangiaceae bacterium]